MESGAEELLKNAWEALGQHRTVQEVIETSAATLFARMLRSGAFDEILVRALQEVAADWLCRGNNDPAAHATALLALRLLDDAYWLLLALEFLDAYFSYVTLL